MRNGNRFSLIVTANLIILAVLVWLASAQIFTAPNSFPALLFGFFVIVTIVAQVGQVIQNARFHAQEGRVLTQRVQELDSICVTIQDGILLLNKDWRILTANHAFVEELGLEGIDLVGQSLFHAPDETGELMARIGYAKAELEADCEALARGEKQRKQKIVTAVGSHERHVERSLSPVHDRENMVTGWLLVLRDVTEEFESTQLRDEMVHMLVHDLRSPLSVTLGSLETIEAWLEMGRTDDVHRLLELAQTGGDRMLQLLNDMLDTYKFESGQVPLDIAPMSVLPWLSDAKAEVLPSAVTDGIEIEVRVEPDLPPIMADRDHMTRALHNLLDNALKFTPNGGTVRLWARLVKNGDVPTALVGISDTGVGVLPEERDMLFQKFEQSASAKGRRKGTGLGLAYCKLVVEAHDGRIWVESEGVAGKGSTFIMALPVYNSAS